MVVYDIARTRHAQNRVLQLVSENRCLLCEGSIGDEGPKLGNCARCDSIVKAKARSAKSKKEATNYIVGLIRRGFRLFRHEIWTIKQDIELNKLTSKGSSDANGK